MIYTNPSPSYTIVDWDATNGWPERPAAQIVLWRGPDRTDLPSAMTTDDDFLEWHLGLPALHRQCTFWLVGDDAVGADDTEISSWPSRVGSTPTISSAPHARYNDDPNARHKGIDFDGTNDYLTVSDLLATGPHTRTTEMTVALVLKHDSVPTRNAILSCDSSGWNGDYLLGVNPNNNGINFRPGWCGHYVENPGTWYSTTSSLIQANKNTTFGSGTNVSSTGYELWVCRTSGLHESIDLRIDGTSVASGALSNGFHIRQDRDWNIGRHQNATSVKFSGKIAEMAVWRTHLDGDELTNMEAFMNTRYGL